MACRISGKCSGPMPKQSTATSVPRASAIASPGSASNTTRAPAARRPRRGSRSSRGVPKWRATSDGRSCRSMSGRFRRTMVNPKTWIRRPGEPSGSTGAMGETGSTSERPSAPNSSDGRTRGSFALLRERAVLGERCARAPRRDRRATRRARTPVTPRPIGGGARPRCLRHPPAARRARARRRSSARAPGRVALGVAAPRLLAQRRAIDLQTHDRACQLEVERGGDLRRGRTQVPLQPFALGVAQLAQPPELQHGQHRQQHDHRGHEPRQHRRPRESPLHERSVAPGIRPRSAANSWFYNLNNLFASP